MHPASLRLLSRGLSFLRREKQVVPAPGPKIHSASSWPLAIRNVKNRFRLSKRCAARDAISCLCWRICSGASAGAGIGGSSAMAVAICAALDRLPGADLRREDWIHISRDVEAIVIRVPTGTQDHYPPAFG